MLRTFVSLAAAGALAAAASPASADPEPPLPNVSTAEDPGPALDNGIVASEPPSTTTTPDDWVLAISAKDETQLPIPPLTTSLSSREYLTGGTFTGSIQGSGRTTLNGGTVEVGYQIGCGIELNAVRLTANIGINSSIGQNGIGNMSAPIQGNIEVRPRPGEVINVSVTKKKFKGMSPRITLKDIHIKIDGCVGESFLQSYAVLTSSTATTEDLVAYYGITKAV
ncbi:MspA protein [Mycobacteroides abscessus subsp. abscessus]|nr:MspA protein [Mycobacteroides abscessus subsp. abscessus]